MQQYLKSCQVIDWQAPTIQEKAATLARGIMGDEAITNACFVFVRDEIKHSWDYQQNPVTLKASDVLKHGTGYCYAKSHLLAALLRANGIPSALCYQRLTIDNNEPPYSLHGLNAVYLEKYGWYRMDARGNKAGVDAQFQPPIEQLAFSIISEGEYDLPELYAEPLAIIVKALTNYTTVADVAENVPDVDL